MSDTNTVISPTSNPLSAAFAYGLGGAACTALGAAICHKDVNNEAMAVLVGGSICGAIFGSAGLMVLMLSPELYKFVDAFLQFGALFATPAMGCSVASYPTCSYNRILIDFLVGNAVLAAIVCFFVGIAIVCMEGGGGGTQYVTYSANPMSQQKASPLSRFEKLEDDEDMNI